MGPLRTERDVINTLAGSEVTITEVYDAIEAAGAHTRSNGTDIIWGQTDRRYRRRARNVLQAMKTSGRAQQTARGRWLIDGTTSTPRRMLLIIAPGELGHIELHLATAADWLRQLADDGIDCDLIIADPPYALDRNNTPNTYARNNRLVVDGYVDVDPGAYRDFTYEWVHAAAELLGNHPGSQLAIITGGPQAAITQLAGEDAGLGYINQLIIRRPFPMRTTRRYAHAHWTATILGSGPDSARFFHIPPELPKAASGRDYPTDVWTDIPKYERQRLLRYDNALPPELISRLIRSYTPGPDNGGTRYQALVVDPFCGSGTTPIVAGELGRRAMAADANVQSLRFTAARLLAEGSRHTRTGRSSTSGNPAAQQALAV